MKYLLTLLLLTSTSLFARPVIKYNSFDIVGAVKSNTRSLVVELQLLVPTPPSTINLNINTPGGSANVMEEMVDVIEELKAAGHYVVCNITKAYSAGFVISAACSQRLATKKASFMWHHGWFMYLGPMNKMIAQEIAKDMEKSQNKWDSMVRQNFIVSDKVFEYIRDKEVFLSAELMNKLSPGYIDIIED